jgi:hypothetical protein
MATAEQLSENSRQGFEVQKPHLIGLETELSGNSRWGCGHVYDETPVGIAVYVRNDPVNLIDPDGRSFLGAIWNGFKAAANAMYSLTLFVGQQIAGFMDYVLHSTISAFQFAQQQAMVAVEVVYSVSAFTGYFPKQILFGPDAAFTKEFMESSAMDQVRKNLKEYCDDESGETSIGTLDAFFYTLFDAFFNGVNLPEAQVGAFVVSWSRKDNDNSVDIVVSNDISLNSWLLHLPEQVGIPNPEGNMMFGTVAQFIYFEIEDPCNEEP